MTSDIRVRCAVLLLGVTPFVGGLGCDEKNPCDADQTWNGSVCEAVTAVDSGSPTPSDSGSPNAPEAGGPTFGSACTDGVTFADCQGAVVNVCLIDPRKTDGVGYCSFAGCDQQPVCPTGWLCYDLSSIQAGAPWACLDPSKI